MRRAVRRAAWPDSSRDVWNRSGEPEQARIEVQKAQRLETSLKRNPPPRL